MIDSIIIGCGPAGVSAALYLHKLNHEVAIIGKDLGHLTSLDIIDNFYGHNKIKGDELIQKGIDQAIDLGISYYKDFVLSVEKVDDHFLVQTVKHTYTSKTVVIATGKNRIPLRMKGYANYKGRGIHLCATCDGYFYKNKKIAIIGSGDYMLQELSILENYTNDITIFSNGKPFTHSKYKVIEEPIKEFIGEKRLTQIITDTNSYETKGAFIAVGFPQANELALKLGVLVENNNIIVDEDMQTNIPGVFSGGDAIGGKLQIAKAVYDGLLISDGIHKYIKKVTE
ncbi:NAD(P)/FAD-dependent oxidoreductase [Acholeplasma hippikon]|uniref:Thioredoxin reductase n=1 Tax=Acholeplasma hippikon TaxID=264636 RepID=A0A449BKT6_9MOLU|nr:NAD(P)/FAD-dependent oxidoreductase [Acholeplasma hippikon]VEU82947.1 thioredoxin reductase [Acholeplasma hippikon]